MDKYCSVSRVVSSIDVRIAGLLSLSRPRAWTSDVWAASVRLSGVDMLLVLQARSDMLHEGSLCI